MPERLSGYDTSFFHFADHSPVHTLKCLVLDTSRRGSSISLDDLRSAVVPRLALHPRARQRAVRAASLPGRFTWFDDPDFDLDRHLDEAVVDEDTSFDAVCGRLAATALPMDRPLWSATLVHGLAGGHQAVVLRIHHAITDGIGAANAFRLFTTESPGEPIPSAPESEDWRPPPIPAERSLRRDAMGAVPRWARSLGTYTAETISGRTDRREDARLIRSRDDLIGLRSEATYGWTGARFGGDRICAHGSLPFETFSEIRRRHGVTVNDVLVAVIGEAIVAEARDRNEERGDEEIAMFNIALDTDPDRLTGNEIMAISVPMHTKGDDLASRLQAIHRTNADQIRLTRRQQDRRSVRITDLWARSFAFGARTFAYRIPTMMSNVVMANVPLSPTTRWIGDIEVVEFISHAVLVQPIGLNVTVYSYDGRMSFGVLTAPEVIDDPQRMIRRFGEALDRFAQAGV